MLQYIEDASKPYDNMRDFDKRKDPFDELDCISEVIRHCSIIL